MIEINSYEVKQKIANENRIFLTSRGILFEGKRVLDVGFGLGFNSKMMSELNGDVYGVEPDKVAYDYAISNNMISEAKALNCTLQELPDELIGTFDIVTLFLYNISFAERHTIGNMLSKVVKKNGIVIVGLHDELYINGDQFISPVSESINPYFENVLVSRVSDYPIGNRYFIVATQPVQELDFNDSIPRRTK